VEETVHSAVPALRSPRRFAAAARRELRGVPGTAWRMFIRSVQARYRQTRLGYVWLVLPTAALTLTWVYLSHANVLPFGDAGSPYAVYVAAGVVLWQLFSEVLTGPLRRLSAASATFTKAPVPHELWILAETFEALFAFAVRLAPLGILLAAYTVSLHWTLLLVPLGVLTLVLLGLAIGLLIAPIGLLYQDVGQGLMIATGLWFLLTPVVYPRPAAGAAAALVSLNPVTPVLESTRAWLTTGDDGSLLTVALIATGAAAVLASAWLVYRVARPHLVARL
jgi:lipopolysaccharide transport system permease protein